MGKLKRLGNSPSTKQKHEGKRVTVVSLSQWNNEIKSPKSAGKDRDT